MTAGMVGETGAYAGCLVPNEHKCLDVNDAAQAASVFLFEPGTRHVDLIDPPITVG